MHKALMAQYQLVVSARHVLFAYCHSMQPADMLKPIPQFNNSSINSLLVHNANTYVHWLIKVAAQRQFDFFEDKDISITAIEKIYAIVDQTVADFLLQFEETLDVAIPFSIPGKGFQLTLSPLQLFTHVITHEFHHKGQILTMSRTLGYTPIDTDIIRT